MNSSLPVPIFRLESHFLCVMKEGELILQTEVKYVADVLHTVHVCMHFHVLNPFICLVQLGCGWLFIVHVYVWPKGMIYLCPTSFFPVLPPLLIVTRSLA